MPSVSKADAARELLRRSEVKQSLVAWCRANEFEPAAHHLLILDSLEKVVRGEIKNLIVCLPPGSAKSTYISYLFPPWFLLQPKKQILACSYNATLIESWSYKCRNLIAQKHKLLGYQLAGDRKAVKEWQTTNGGLYFCAGVGAGIAGHRAHLGVIDDPIGSEDDADSQAFRDKLWNWYHSDFNPRIFSCGSKVIIANRRHEDDLVGRILNEEPKDWYTIILPFFAEDGDALGRKSALQTTDTSLLKDRNKSKQDLALEPSLAPLLESRLWPSYYSAEKAIEVLRAPARTRAGLWQQAPAPVEGNFFREEMFAAYTPDQLPNDLMIYVASDHAVSGKQVENGDRNCLLPVGVDSNGEIWILPDVWWKQAETEETVEAMLSLMKRRKPLVWWGENENIFKSIYPFLRTRMVEEGVHCYVEKLTPTQNKLIRAQSIHGRASMGLVHAPTYTSWWPAALKELLQFPGGKHDDFVDPLAYIGLGIDRLSSANKPRAKVKAAARLTFGWLKDNYKKQERRKSFAFDDP